MLVVPLLLVLGLRRAEVLREAAVLGASAEGQHTDCPWREYTFTPGLMTGVFVRSLDGWRCFLRVQRCACVVCVHLCMYVCVCGVCL